jgi:hypothetical protein
MVVVANNMVRWFWEKILEDEVALIGIAKTMMVRIKDKIAVLIIKLMKMGIEASLSLVRE